MGARESQRPSRAGATQRKSVQHTGNSPTYLPRSSLPQSTCDGKRAQLPAGTTKDQVSSGSRRRISKRPHVRRRHHHHSPAKAPKQHMALRARIVLSFIALLLAWRQFWGQPGPCQYRRGRRKGQGRPAAAFRLQKW